MILLIDTSFLHRQQCIIYKNSVVSSASLTSFIWGKQCLPQEYGRNISSKIQLLDKNIDIEFGRKTSSFTQSLILDIHSSQTESHNFRKNNHLNVYCQITLYRQIVAVEIFFKVHYTANIIIWPS